jgi:hypothetical protein
LYSGLKVDALVITMERDKEEDQEKEEEDKRRKKIKGGHCSPDRTPRRPCSEHAPSPCFFDE